MAAHGRHDERAGAGVDQHVQGSLDDLFKVSDAPAADTQRNPHAGRNLLPQSLLGELFLQQSDEIQSGRRGITLPHRKHFGKVHENKYPHQ